MVAELDTESCIVIVKDAKRNLYLREAPNSFRGGTRWNEFKRMAIRFNGMKEAVAAVDSLNDKKNLDIIYELLDENETDSSEMKRFMVEIYMEDSSSIVHWSAKTASEIFDMAIKLASRAKKSLMSVVITEKESVV